jgi:hypothetical protein
VTEPGKKSRSRRSEKEPTITFTRVTRQKRDLARKKQEDIKMKKIKKNKTNKTKEIK